MNTEVKENWLRKHFGSAAVPILRVYIPLGVGFLGGIVLLGGIYVLSFISSLSNETGLSERIMVLRLPFFCIGGLLGLIAGIYWMVSMKLDDSHQQKHLSC